MRHCCEFDAFDIWYLKDNEEFSNRTLFIGECPRCHKHVSLLHQKNNKTNNTLMVKKVGEASLEFSKSLISEIAYSRNSLNKMKFKAKPYGWKYGINKEKTDKKGKTYLAQYSADFFGNVELIKKNK